MEVLLGLMVNTMKDRLTREIVALVRGETTGTFKLDKPWLAVDMVFNKTIKDRKVFLRRK